MKPDINVTPLIDVLLVLLIIFMVISPLKPAQFETKIPSEPDRNLENIQTNPDTLVVEVNTDATLELNNQSAGTINESEKLQNYLTDTFNSRVANQAFAESKIYKNIPASEKIEKTVFIKAPKSMEYGQIAKVIDSVKIAGANPVSLQIDDLQ